MPKNIIEKIWEKHIVNQKENHPEIFAIDLLLMHEVTSAQAFSMLKEKNLKPYDVKKIIATIDHSTPTRKNRHLIFDELAKKQVETLRENVKKYWIEFYDFDSWNQWILHVVWPDLWAIHPWMTIACGDSHTATHWAFWAIAFWIWTSEVWHILATWCLLQKKPKTMKVEFKWKMKKWVFSKDLVMKLIADIWIWWANWCIIEYTWEAVKNISMEERMTICNMSIECGARAWLFAVDEITFNYIKWRKKAPKDFEKAKKNWLKLNSDNWAKYDKEIIIDISKLNPMISWGTNPEQSIQIWEKIPEISKIQKSHQLNAKKSLDYIKLKEWQKIEWVKIDWAFVGSCTNWRIEDLRIVAEILDWKKINKSVIFYIVPWSESVRNQAIEEWLDKIFEKSWADFRMPWCSLCLWMNDDKIPAWKRCISSSNRNFIWRQWTWSFTHLASPASVAISSIYGEITNYCEYV